MKVAVKPAHKRAPQVIAVTSGKGGVGKTSVTANLALALRALGHRVVILDGDMGLANIDIVFNISPKYTIADLLAGRCTLDDLLAAGPNGVHVIPGASGVMGLTAISESERLTMIEQMDQLEDRCDVLLLDTAAGISKNVLDLNSAAQTILVLVTPEPTSLTDAYALIKVMAAQYHEREFGIIVNQVKSEKEAKEIFSSLIKVTDRFLDDVVLDYVDHIPSDESVRKAVRSQRPFWISAPDGPASQAVRRIAERVLKMGASSPKGGLQFFLNRILQGSNDQ